MWSVLGHPPGKILRFDQRFLNAEYGFLIHVYLFAVAFIRFRQGQVTAYPSKGQRQSASHRRKEEYVPVKLASGYRR